MSEAKTKTNFIKLFNQIDRSKNRYKIFEDFVTVSAISLHNAVAFSKTLEDEYMSVVARYDKESFLKFSELFAILIELLEPSPKDILGDLFMDMGLGNNKTGQFFTPFDISLLIAEISYKGQIDLLEQNPYITISEPACGAGGMILAFANILIKHNKNPANTIWVQAIDIDRIAGLMCYLQLSLWNIPAQIIIGDTLSLKFREVFYTPAHYLNNWDYRLANKKAQEFFNKTTEPEKTVKKTAKPIEKPLGNDGEIMQFDFGF